MQVDVGKQRRDHRSLPRPPVTNHDDPVFEHARLQPFLDQADDAPVADPVLQETDQPLLTNRVKERPDVGVHNEAHLLAVNPDTERIQRTMRAATGPESIREPEEVLLVDRVQQRDHRPLDDLVLQGCDRERALLTVRLGDVYAPGRQCPIRSALDPLMQVLDIVFEVCLVVLPRPPIHAGGCVLRQRVERLLQQFNGDVVEERGEPLLLPFPCGLPYAFLRL